MTLTIKQRDIAKREHPNQMILVRVGDFYELFREDAELASKLLGLTLTRMSKTGGGADIPMCGFPYHQLEGYLSRLVTTGHSVAVFVAEEPKESE